MFTEMEAHGLRSEFASGFGFGNLSTPYFGEFWLWYPINLY